MDAQIDFRKGDAILPEQAMQLAIEVAMAGAPYVSPNPLVGCVAVDSEHKFLAYGFHPKYGMEHAEINVLNKLSDTEIKNATFYVTLEPCAHEGKTGSCAKKLATLPIKKVVYGLVDPNALVSGKGAAILQGAKIETELYNGALKNELLQLCEVFLKNFTQKKVFFAAKIATSLDGQIGLKNGESKWITSDKSRNYVHQLRSYYDAILVGANTIKQDDPSLDIRHHTIKKENKLIVFDEENTIYKSDYKFKKIHKADNIIFVVAKKDVANPYLQIELKNLSSLSEALWPLGIRSVFIEGGARTYSSFLNAGLLDRLYLFMAPAVIGAGGGLSWTNGVEIKSLSKKIVFANPKILTIGDDIFVTVRKPAVGPV